MLSRLQSADDPISWQPFLLIILHAVKPFNIMQKICLTKTHFIIARASLTAAWFVHERIKYDKGPNVIVSEGALMVFGRMVVHLAYCCILRSKDWDWMNEQQHFWELDQKCFLPQNLTQERTQESRRCLSFEACTVDGGEIITKFSILWLHEIM